MRKLAAFAFSFSAAVLTCNYLLERPAWLFFAGVFAAAFLGCFFLMREKRRLLCCLLCAGFGFGFSGCGDMTPSFFNRHGNWMTKRFV